MACEALVKLEYNGSIIANLLATPVDFYELMIGHLVCEGFMPTNPVHVEHSFNVEESSRSYHCSMLSQMEIDLASASNRVITSSCGACNSDDLEQLISDLPIVEKDTSTINFNSLNKCFNSMRERQLGFQLTGGMHAAGITDSTNDLLFVLEDIGRHNAVDKVIGKALTSNINLSETTLLLSGRCGWDIVAKASRCGIANIVSIGACSSLAAKAARYTGVRIISFLKHDNAVIIGQN